MKILLLNLLTLVVFGYLAVFSTGKISTKEFLPHEDASQEDEVLYLPNIKAIKFASFGYKNFLADIIWFKTINYFGKHYRADRNYRWLFTLCDLITTLNPDAEHVYEFGAMMLAWEQNVPDKAIELLDKALSTKRESWTLFYYRGIFKLYFKKDNEGALNDFIEASKLPGVHTTVIGLASKKLAELNDENEGVKFLESILNTTTDESLKSVLLDKIKKLEKK